MHDTTSHEHGILYLVATPIGNLKDITYRAVEILNEVDLVLCEDTRRARKLLNHYTIRAHLKTYHDHNKEQRTPEILKRLKNGEEIALITDAGTPGIADPGYYLTSRAIAEKIPVAPVPGASALTAALSASGLPTDKFTFCGFVPRKSGKRRKLLESLSSMEMTVILYESPYRVLKTLQCIVEVFGAERDVVIARELTKIYEEFIRGTAPEVLEELANRSSIKGEFVILISGKNEEDK